MDRQGDGSSAPQVGQPSDSSVSSEDGSSATVAAEALDGVEIVSSHQDEDNTDDSVSTASVGDGIAELSATEESIAMPLEEPLAALDGT